MPRIEPLSVSRRVFWALAFVYILGLLFLFAYGEGIAAAFFAMPGSYPVFYATDWIPEDSALEAFAYSWLGNALLLLLSASVNVALLYVAVRWFQSACRRAAR